MFFILKTQQIKNIFLFLIKSIHKSNQNCDKIIYIFFKAKKTISLHPMNTSILNSTTFLGKSTVMPSPEVRML